MIAGGLPGRPGVRLPHVQSKRPRGEEMALLTTEDVLNKKFQYVKFREGYDQDEVCLLYTSDAADD